MAKLIYSLLLAVLLVVFVAPVAKANDEPLRDLEKKPLNSSEWQAFRASASLVAELNRERVKNDQEPLVVLPQCVNATSGAEGTAPVTLHFFYRPQEEGDKPKCGDPHHSIKVEFTSEGQILSITYVDA